MYNRRASIRKSVVPPSRRPAEVPGCDPLRAKISNGCVLRSGRQLTQAVVSAHRASEPMRTSAPSVSKDHIRSRVRPTRNSAVPYLPVPQTTPPKTSHPGDSDGNSGGPCKARRTQQDEPACAEQTRREAEQPPPRHSGAPASPDTSPLGARRQQRTATAAADPDPEWTPALAHGAAGAQRGGTGLEADEPPEGKREHRITKKLVFTTQALPAFSDAL